MENKRSKTITTSGESKATPSTSSNASLAPMSTSSPRASSDDLKRKKVPQPPVKSSPRLQQKKEAEMAELSAMVKGGKPSGAHSTHDVTPLFNKPLDDGKDGRGYVSRPVRTELEDEVLKTKRKVASLDDSSLHPALSGLHTSLTEKGIGYKKASTRTAMDGFKSGFDVSLTLN